MPLSLHKDLGLHENLMDLKGSIEELGRLIREPSDLQREELPDLDDLISDWYNDDVNVTEEAFARRILRVFQHSTHNEVYKQVVSNLPPEQQVVLADFLAGKVTAEDAGSFLDQQGAKIAAAEPREGLTRDQATGVVFENWGRTVKQTPAITYYPETTQEIQAIVRESVKNNRGVRVSGFRHSWAPVFGRDQKPGQPNNGDVLISTLTQHNAAVLPNFTALPTSLFQPRPSELNSITVVDAAYVAGPVLTGGKKYVRVGTSTTNEQFRRWCINVGRVTEPMNAILTEVTMGGTNATICHGAGISHPTLSDLVRCIEYVDVNAQVRSINMSTPDLMKAASGCFGLLGVVTHITLECDAISTAVMRPTKLDVIDAIPPPPELKFMDIPFPLRKVRTDEQRRIAQQEFERRANNEYYAEWFWFPYSSQVWVNTWSTEASTDNVVNYPSYAKTFLQVLGTIIINIAQNIVQKIDALEKFPYLQTTFLSWLSMKNLDVRTEKQDPIRTLLPNALHFQRGVTNVRVRDVELEFPLLAKKSTTTGTNSPVERDYTNVQRAWWSAILLCYANKSTCPQRMPLEMRITGPSNVTMAPQRTHLLGSCSIEILTLRAAADLWEPYAQSVINSWLSLKDNDGKQLVVRPHWAKEWDQYKVDGRPWRQKLRNETYVDEIAEFRGLLARIGQSQGWTLADLRRTFSNELLDYLFLDDVEERTETVHVTSERVLKMSKNEAVLAESEIINADVTI